MPHPKSPEYYPPSYKLLLDTLSQFPLEPVELEFATEKAARNFRLKWYSYLKACTRSPDEKLLAQRRAAAGYMIKLIGKKCIAVNRGTDEQEMSLMEQLLPQLKAAKAQEEFINTVAYQEASEIKGRMSGGGKVLEMYGQGDGKRGQIIGDNSTPQEAREEAYSSDVPVPPEVVRRAQGLDETPPTAAVPAGPKVYSEIEIRTMDRLWREGRFPGQTGPATDTDKYTPTHLLPDGWDREKAIARTAVPPAKETTHA
jgi:hypothetical protein